MGALIFFVAIGLWLVLCIALARHIPIWLGVKRVGWAWGLLLFPILVVAPVIDEVIGKQQFASLCEKRIFLDNSDAIKARNIHRVTPPYTKLPGFWIPIEMRTVKYVDDETNQVILSNDDYHTKGGWLFGNSYIFGMEKYCLNRPEEIEQMRRLEQLIEQGKKS
jgi:hypothetical protein